ncbi:MAG: hypothetical protein NC223_02650 [Butyrivibrio sp.]|nr:hypothetical protein [Butyrivibrio sp.]
MKGKQIASMICGIMSLIWAWASYGAVVGIVLGIVAVVLSSGVKNAGAENGMSKAGFICGLIGIILSAVMLIVWIACAGCAACAAAL